MGQSRMFKSVNKTWNPFTGCEHRCVYCWAVGMALNRLSHLEKYRNGFEPTFHPKELNKRFKPGDFVFVSSMGDISFALVNQREAIYEVIRKFPDTDFLLQTKNPYVFYEDISLSEGGIPKNVYLGTTIETNRSIVDFSDAPCIENRVKWMSVEPLRPYRRFLSIEPIMDFDVDDIIVKANRIMPSIIEIGADNYHHHLPEPSWDKVQELMTRLRNVGMTVKEKKGLERLNK